MGLVKDKRMAGCACPPSSCSLGGFVAAATASIAIPVAFAGLLVIRSHVPSPSPQNALAGNRTATNWWSNYTVNAV